MERVEDCFSITTEADVISALGSIMNFGIKRRLDSVGLCQFVTAISELGTNLVKYAKKGTLRIAIEFHEDRSIGTIISNDSGPGINDIEKALLEGFSTGDSLGLGLPSCKRQCDSFEIDSSPQGTKIVLRKEMSYQ